MTEAIDALRSAMNNDVYRLDSLSQNLANISTAGYKREIAVFNPSGAVHEYAAGGLPSNDISRSKEKDFSQGVLNYTGNDLDLSLDGKAFFVVEKDGNKYGTRVANLTVNAEGKLVGTHNEELQGQGGAIFLEPGKFQINDQGVISQNGKVIEKLLLVDASNASKGGYIGQGFYALNHQEMAAPLSNTKVRQGYVEISNVNTMDEMIQLIETTRHFEAAHGILQSYDSIMGMSVNKLAEF